MGPWPPVKGAVKFANCESAGSGFRVDGDVNGLDAMAKLDVYTQTGMNKQMLSVLKLEVIIGLCSCVTLRPLNEPNAADSRRPFSALPRHEYSTVIAPTLAFASTHLHLIKFLCPCFLL
jgi:hypothetical protein